MFKFLGSLLVLAPNIGVYYKTRRIAGSAASTCWQSCARAADADATPMSVGIPWIHAANDHVHLASDAPNCVQGGIRCGWTHSSVTEGFDTRTSRGNTQGSCTGSAI